MKDNADLRRIHSAVCVTVQMTLAARASSTAKAHYGIHSIKLNSSTEFLTPGQHPLPWGIASFSKSG
jgi:hypothetical protein